MSAFVPAGQQREAMDKIRKWYAGYEQVFRYFGYAGTGKTTSARHIVDELGIKAAYAAYTGKAAYVLRSKGCDGASTLHALIYQPVEALRQEVDDLRAQLDAEPDPDMRAALERAIEIEEDKLGSPDFILRSNTPLKKVSLLVVDEVSMVNEDLAVDLLSFGVKLLVLGDPAQLPPVGGDGYFTSGEPDYLLTEIHRSALDSPVTRLATAVRHSQDDDPTLGIPGLDGDSGRIGRITPGQVGAFDQVLVGTNRVRWQAIHLLRELAGRSTAAPEPGDRIMILANSRDFDVFNGQQFKVIAATPGHLGDRYYLRVVDDAGTSRRLVVWASGFRDLDGEREAARQRRGPVVAATFAQAVTVHKAQGSQWDRVLVVDESEVTAKYNGPSGARRWLYTAVTRAAKQVVVIPPTALPLARR